MTMTLGVGILALTGGLASAGFVKAFGITVLAIPRSAAAEHAHEAPLSMRIGMAILAAACAGFGLAAAPILSLLTGVVGVGARLPAATGLAAGLSLSTPEGLAQMSPVLVAVGLALAVAGVWAGVRIVGGGRGLRLADTRGCGRVVQTPRMEHTSTAFAEPLRRVFAELYRPTKDLSIDFHPESRSFVQSIEYRSEIVPWFERYLYAPLIAYSATLGRADPRAAVGLRARLPELSRHRAPGAARDAARAGGVRCPSSRCCSRRS